MNKININKEVLESLKKEYIKAVNNNRESFNFQGHKLLTSYVKYLILYLEIKLKK